jgi:hypothetical protein
MPRAFVVVGEGVALEADLRPPRGHGDASRRRRAARPRTPRGVHAGLGQLQRLQHRLVVLVLVLEQHLDDERRDGVEASEHALPHGAHVGDRLGAAQVGEIGSLRARGLGRVVDLGEVGAQQLEAGLAANPEVLERGDVAEVPDQRTHQRVVLAVEVGLGYRLDQGERASAGLVQQRLDPSKGR